MGLLMGRFVQVYTVPAVQAIKEGNDERKSYTGVIVEFSAGTAESSPCVAIQLEDGTLCEENIYHVQIIEKPKAAKA